MSIQKVRNRWFILKIVLLTLLMIAAFAGILVSVVFLTQEGTNLTFITLLFVSVGFLPWSILRMIKLNNGWKKQIQEDIDNGTIETKFVWMIEKNEWQEYIIWRKQLAREEVMGFRLWSSLAAIAIFLFAFYSSMELVQWLLVSVLGGIAFGVLIGSMFGFGLQLRIKQLNANTKGKIVFTEKAILVNGLLIFFDQMATSLKNLKATEENNRKVIQVTTETSAGERSNTADYYIPIPNDDMDQAREVEVYYRDKIV